LTDSYSEIITVDKNGEGEFESIQEAIDNAKPGSKVYIKPGEYKEIISINKKISIIGEDKDTTLISPISEKNKYAICLGAPEVTICHLSIKNGAPGLYASGIRVKASNTQISNCDIFDTPVGIVIWTSNNIVDNCNFWGCDDEGVALIGTQYSDCNNNKITNCKFRENCDGIELQYSSSNTISNCDFYDNTHTGIDAIASSNNNNIILNCRIYNNEAHGVYLSSSSENQIKDCFIYNNNNGNIVMNENSKNNQVQSNSENDRMSLREVFRNFLSRIYYPNEQRIVSSIRSILSF
jgi:parallel beta-helix repeat protein